MSHIRKRAFFPILVLALVVAACGDDDVAPGVPTTTAGGENGSPGGNGQASGSSLTLGDETFALGGGLCYLQEQPAAAGGGSILATAQASGTTADGERVHIDFTRWSEESMFAGDDITVEIGPLGNSTGYSAVLDIGAVDIAGSVVSGSGVTFQADDGSEVTGAFAINC